MVDCMCHNDTSYQVLDSSEQLWSRSCHPPACIQRKAVWHFVAWVGCLLLAETHHAGESTRASLLENLLGVWMACFASSDHVLTDPNLATDSNLATESNLATSFHLTTDSNLATCPNLANVSADSNLATAGGDEDLDEHALLVRVEKYWDRNMNSGRSAPTYPRRMGDRG